ncbi:MAG: hypothetical protein MJ252_21035 [archaeon]|nr:hypothetical protein [archaeon]
MAYIEGLPVNSEPEVFGLHENADIITNQNEGEALLETVLGIQPKDAAGAGKSREEILLGIVEDIEKKMPPAFDREAIKEKFPTDYHESLNTVLNQEVLRYNNLILIIQESIEILKKALTGKIVLTTEYEEVCESIFVNQVPAMWSTVFTSLKPLSSWVADLVKRVTFFADWVKAGTTPSTFWFSSFSFPAAFMTGTLQVKIINLFNF